MANIHWDMNEIQKNLGKWADSVFGKKRSPIGALYHLQEEAFEAMDEPYDIMEYADCMMLIIDATRNAGFTADELMEAVNKKLRINQRRKWGRPDKNGVINHIKEK